MPVSPPIIITLTLESPWQAYFTQLRKQYFPAHCNYLDAHLTLFHHLPNDLELINNHLLELSQSTSSVQLNIKGLKNLGNGVAFDIECAALQMLHKTMQQRFGPWLISQDRQKLWPHITIQNKVTAFKAEQTLVVLQQSFEPFQVKGIGFSAWHYLKGSWKYLKDYPFK